MAIAMNPASRINAKSGAWDRRLGIELGVVADAAVEANSSARRTKVMHGKAQAREDRRHHVRQDDVAVTCRREGHPSAPRRRRCRRRRSGDGVDYDREDAMADAEGDSSRGAEAEGEDEERLQHDPAGRHRAAARPAWRRGARTRRSRRGGRAPCEDDEGRRGRRVTRSFSTASRTFASPRIFGPKAAATGARRRHHPRFARQGAPPASQSRMRPRGRGPRRRDAERLAAPPVSTKASGFASSSQPRARAARGTRRRR